MRKMTMGEFLYVFVITVVLTALVYTGCKDVTPNAEQELDIKEKAFWDIEVKKMEEANTESVAHWEIIKMNVSAYCPCEKCCEQWAGIPVSSGKRKTASGHTIHVGDKFVAAPRTYPFGTEMIIEGYAGGSIVKVEDVGGAIKGNKLDLYFDNHDDALQWGRKDVFVKVKVYINPEE